MKNYIHDIVEKLYGVKANFNEEKNKWKIDKETTREYRKSIIRKRREESMTYDEF